MRRRLLNKANKSVSNGVYILGTDNKLYACSDWVQPTENAVGVAIIQDKVKVVMDPKKNTVYGKYSPTNQIYLKNFSSFNLAVTDFDGEKNTEVLLNSSKSQVAQAARNIVFKNGKRGYIPSLGEWSVVSSNYNELSSCLQKLGGYPPAGMGYFSTSTQCDYGKHWQCMGIFSENGCKTWGNTTNVSAFVVASLG